MKTPLILLLAFTIPSFVSGRENWPVHPDSVEKPGVPKGEILNFQLDDSKVFPETSRKIWVYVPTQYDGSKPACLLVCQDGIKYDSTTVCDNLIHAGDMPVTIGVFAAHGRHHIDEPETKVDRLNRSYEYDSVIDSYALFLQTDLLPAVERLKTSDGRDIRISKRTTDRMIAGNSNGGIAAFTAAFLHPEW